MSEDHVGGISNRAASHRDAVRGASDQFLSEVVQMHILLAWAVDPWAPSPNCPREKIEIRPMHKQQNTWLSW